MTRGEVQVFIASLHVVRDELAKANAEVPARVLSELSAMEAFLKREWDENPRVNKLKSF